VLGPGDRIPDVSVWQDAGQEAAPLRDVLAGDGLALLCFYPFDWSPT
jgi:hypothetical protein